MAEKYPMRIAVCDDEKEIRNSIARNIRLIDPDAKIILFENGESLTAYTGGMDILFLDIQMKGMDGMEAARILRKAGQNVVIIFVTGDREAVFQAFDVGAFHYLLKPFDRAKFFAVLQKAVAKCKAINVKKSELRSSLAVKIGAVTQKVFLDEIFYLEVFNRKVMIHRADGVIEFYGRLSELEERLSADFVRCHRAYLVNLRYVLKYDRSSITLENGAILLLAKQKYADFVRRYMKYTSGLIHK